MKERRESKIEPPLLPSVHRQQAGARAAANPPSRLLPEPRLGAAQRVAGRAGGVAGCRPQAHGQWRCAPAPDHRPRQPCGGVRGVRRRWRQGARALEAGAGAGIRRGAQPSSSAGAARVARYALRAASFSCNPLCCSPSSLARLGRHEASAARSARGGVHGDIYTHCATPLCALCLWPRAQSLTLQSRLPRDPLRPNSSAPTSLAAMAARARSQRLRHQQMRACRAWTSPRAPPWRTRSRW